MQNHAFTQLHLNNDKIKASFLIVKNQLSFMQIFNIFFFFQIKNFRDTEKYNT